MKAIQAATPIPVKMSITILLRPKASCRKKYSDEMSVITATKKGNMYFLLILITAVE